ANAELVKGDYQKALDLFIQARKIFEKVGNKTMLATTDAMIAETSSKIQPVPTQTLPLSPTLILIPILLVVAIIGGGIGFILIRKRRNKNNYI
ncbi:MAG TPA: hypothetical protein HA367_01440, partial [Candidatus Methanofastidiosum sp.]|nr:hypothetical protein [Methanofastidiosum sp.]